jgi:hypothetical protein
MPLRFKGSFCASAIALRLSSSLKVGIELLQYLFTQIRLAQPAAVESSP